MFLFLFFVNLGLGFASSPSRYPDPPSAGQEDIDTVIEDVAKAAAADADDGPAYPQDEQAAVHTPYKVKFAALEWWQTLWEEA